MMLMKPISVKQERKRNKLRNLKYGIHTLPFQPASSTKEPTIFSNDEKTMLQEILGQFQDSSFDEKLEYNFQNEEKVEFKHKDPEAHQKSVSCLGKTQRQAYDRAIRGESLFCTGGAGKGKTHLLKLIRDGFLEQGRTVFVVAPTGVAANHVSGSTLDSFMRVPASWFQKRKLINVLQFFSKNPDLLLRFSLVEVLIIDEVSMVSGKRMDWLDRILQLANNNSRPMGNKQVITFGDFYQLPPVDSSTFCFETAVWQKLFPPERSIDLLESFRQKDPEFVSLLNRARVGSLSSKDITVLNRIHQETKKKRVYFQECEYRSRLLPTKIKVESYNEQCQLQTKRISMTKRFTKTVVLNPWLAKQKAHHESKRKWFKSNKSKMSMESKAEYAETLSQFEMESEVVKEQLMADVPVLDELDLCIGSRVMLVKNWRTEEGLVHGRSGWVLGFEDSGPIVQFDGGDSPILVPPLEWSESCKDGKWVISQIPLSFSWAMTIHKSQGLSMTKADLDLGKMFASGQAYVGLSRLTTLEGLGLLEFSEKCCFANPKVKEFYGRTFPDSDQLQIPEWMRPEKKKRKRLQTKEVKQEAKESIEPKESKEITFDEGKQKDVVVTAVPAAVPSTEEGKKKDEQMLKMFGKHWVAFLLFQMENSPFPSTFLQSVKHKVLDEITALRNERLLNSNKKQKT